MNFTTITANLDTQTKAKLDTICEKRGATRGDIFYEALLDFNAKYGRGKVYKLKHYDIDRLHSHAIIIKYYDEHMKIVNKFTERLGIKRTVFVREVICEYIDGLDR